MRSEGHNAAEKEQLEAFMGHSELSWWYRTSAGKCCVSDQDCIRNTRCIENPKPTVKPWLYKAIDVTLTLSQVIIETISFLVALRRITKKDYYTEIYEDIETRLVLLNIFLFFLWHTLQFSSLQSRASSHSKNRNNYSKNDLLKKLLIHFIFITFVRVSMEHNNSETSENLNHIAFLCAFRIPIFCCHYSRTPEVSLVKHCRWTNIMLQAQHRWCYDIMDTIVT